MSEANTEAKLIPDDRNGYWAGRANSLNYSFTFDMAKKYAPNAKSAIDVGCFVAPVICQLDWIPVRIANDLAHIPEWDGVQGVKFVQGDAFALNPRDYCDDDMFDLAISHQTIEHIEDAKGFADKLCKLGRRVICSTSYEVEAGLIAGHVQDPISLQKFESWFPRPAQSILIERHPGGRFANILGIF